jgi:hypothetical protein
MLDCVVVPEEGRADVPCDEVEQPASNAIEMARLAAANDKRIFEFLLFCSCADDTTKKNAA